MAAHRRLIIALVAVVALWRPGPAAADTLLLVDRSGSMRPYYESRLIHELVGKIFDAAAAVEAPAIVAFNTATANVANLSAFQSIAATGNTNLTAALASAEKYDRVWLLTDNVHDSGGSQDMAGFYQALQSDHLQTIYVFPLRQPAGAAGLLLYAMSSVVDDVPLGEQIRRFRDLNRERNLTELLMKPLGENAISVQLLDSADAVTFHAGDPLQLQSRVRIGPKFAHLYFESSPAIATRLRNPFQSDDCLVAEKGDSAITPDFVQTSEAGEYTVSVDFGRVSLKKDLECLFRAAFQQTSASAEIQTPVSIDVPRGNLRLSKSFLEQDSADNEPQAKETGKISGLQHIPGYVAVATVHVPIRIPRNVTVVYPGWPAVVLVGGGIVLALGVIAGGVLLMSVLGARAAKLYAEAEDGSPLPCTTTADGQVRVDGDPIGKVDAMRFTPGVGVRLESGRETASILTPLVCIVPGGRRMRLSTDKPKTAGQSSPSGIRPRTGRQAPPPPPTRR